MFFAFIFFVPLITFSQKDIFEKSVRLTLADQEKAWNNGDLVSYMNGYWNNDSLKFIGKSGIQYGWQKTLDNYKKSYPDKSSMGNLKFEIVKIELLSDNSAFVIGKWALTREKGDINGYFTLLFKIIDGKTVIVCDHSS
ncbi:MAG: DUF4440 domain-containing protein [Bacteroidia bacterium]|nr:DUF4440 domain-containing protein [Bacteroidia bacterium]